jgi:hypothetical protein
MILDRCDSITARCCPLSASSEKKSAVVNSGSTMMPNKMQRLAMIAYRSPPLWVSQYIPNPATNAPTISPYSSHVFNDDRGDKTSKILRITVLAALSFPVLMALYSLIHAVVYERRKERRIQEILRNWRGFP